MGQNQSVTMLRFVKTLLCLLAFVCSTAPRSNAAAIASADRTFQFRSRVWQVESPLPQNAVQAIAQTPDGFLWLGTQAGLVRFDGYQFHWCEFPELKGARINALAVAQDESLWVGTAMRGVYRILRGTVTHYSLDGIADPRVLSLCADPDGSVWIGTVGGLALFDGKQIQRNIGAGVLATDAVRAIAHEGHERHWFASAGRVFMMRGLQPTGKLGQAEGVPSIYLRALLMDDTGTLWIGSNAGLSALKNGKFKHYTKADGLPDDTVSALFQDSNRRLWVGTYSGLCRKKGNKFVPVLADDGEPFDQIFAIAEDREHNVWAGAKDGLIRLREDRFKTFLTRDGLAHNNVISILGDEAGMWIGTWGGGLHYFKDGERNIWTRDTNPVLKSDLILALHKARDGSLWFGTDYDGGLYHLKEGTLVKVKESGPVRSHAIRDIHEDREGTLWVATGFGLIRNGNGSEFRKYLSKDGLPADVVRCVAEDARGVLWVGTENGLVRHAGGSFEAVPGLAEERILCLYSDAATNLWVGTPRGLSRRDNGMVIECSARNPLLTNSIVEILEDDAGFLWLSSDRGVLRVNKADLLRSEPGQVKCDLFGEADGMVSSVCVGTAKPASWKTPDGILWFATTRGVVATDSRRPITNNAVAPPVYITRFRANKKPVSIKSTPVSIAPGQGNLEFDYTALSFNDPERNAFKYMLAGYDTEWVEAGTRRTAFYNNLRPGNYQFKVIACNNDGVWNEEGALIAFTLMPHFWQAKWFQAAVPFAALLFAGLFARHVTKRRLQTRLARLEQEHALEKERTRIAQDMHDELGARITEILLIGKSTLQTGNDSGAVARGVQRICAAAQEIATDLNAIVFAVNPKNDSLEPFVAYICKYVEKYLSATTVRCRLDVPLDVPDLPVSSEVRHHVVMSIKEALNNALKHSEATVISVEVKVDDARLSIAVIDDGKGFDDTQTGNLGNGLPGMRERMKAIGGCVETSSVPGKGTRVYFNIPLKDSFVPREQRT